MIKNPSNRRYEMDWLRVLAILFFPLPQHPLFKFGGLVESASNP
jgi:hypothetical protein